MNFKNCLPDSRLLFIGQRHASCSCSRLKSSPYRLRKCLIVLVLAVTPFGAWAQVENDSLKTNINRVIRTDFPGTRTFNLEYEHSFSRDYESELNEQDFTRGNIADQRRVDFAANIPLISKQKWNISATGNYRYFRFNFDDVEILSNMPGYTPSDIRDFHYYAVSLNATHYSTLFSKPFIYNASVITDGSADGVERLKGFISGSIVVKRNANTTLTVGLYVMLDPSAQIPFSPLFSYNHRFVGSPWELDIILPQRILFRRAINAKSRLSVGSTFGADAFYVHENAISFPGVYSYSQLKLDGGIIYEYKFTDRLIATVKGGVRKYISNRLTEKTESTANYIYKNDQDVTGYFNVGISFNPFNK